MVMAMRLSCGMCDLADDALSWSLLLDPACPAHGALLAEYVQQRLDGTPPNPLLVAVLNADANQVLREHTWMVTLDPAPTAAVPLPPESSSAQTQVVGITATPVEKGRNRI